jgi:hypothetical protein
MLAVRSTVNTVYPARFRITSCVAVLPVIVFAEPLNVTALFALIADAVSVGLAVLAAVKSLLFPLLSFQVSTSEPFSVMPVDDESAPSSHNAHPAMSVGCVTATTGPASVV